MAPYDKLAKLFTKYFGHITKMAAMPIYAKHFNTLLRQNQKADVLGMQHLGCKVYQVCSNDDPRLPLT